MGCGGSKKHDEAVLVEFNQLLVAGQLKESQGDARSALRLYEQCLTCTQRISNAQAAKAVEGSALGNLGSAYNGLGQHERAVEHLKRALAISREIGDRQGEATRLGSLGNAYRSLGQSERAIETATQLETVMQRDVGHAARSSRRSRSETPVELTLSVGQKL